MAITTPESAGQQNAPQSEDMMPQGEGKSMKGRDFQVIASRQTPPPPTPGANYERGNRPDPSNNVGAAEIRSSEGRIANVGDHVKLDVIGVAEGWKSITWRFENDLRYARGSKMPAVSHVPGSKKSITPRAEIQGLHTIIATVTPATGSSFELSYKLNVEPSSRDYADVGNVKPSPLATMDDFIALVERIESAYSSLNWQIVVAKIRAEQYPGRGGAYGGVMRAFTWDDLINEMDEVAPLQKEIASPADIAALRANQNVSFEGKTIDIGHVLTGVDSMNFPGTDGIFERNKMSGPAAATWSGDVGSALTNWATSHPLNDLSAKGKEKFYQQYSSMDDILGDLDGINLGGMASLPKSAKLSQRLRAYYKTNKANGASRRFHNFCSVSGFEIQNGKLSQAARAYIRTQILNFAIGYNIKGALADGMILSGGGYGGAVSAETIKLTSRARIEAHIDWFSNYFIQQLETNLAKEK
jgi:hypothetical protein